VFVSACANIDIAAKRVVWGRMLNAGQQCIAPDYCLVDKKVVHEFLAACKVHVAAMFTKDGPSNIGRIVGPKQMERLMGVLANHGGKLVVGGTVKQTERYIEPTVIHVALDSPAMEEETFGPILIVVAVDSMDDAIRYVNTRPKPLSLYIFASTSSTQERIIRNTSSGGVTVNGVIIHAGHHHLPFGGIGDSGTGSYHGRATFDTFVHHKPVLKKSVWKDGGLLSDPFFLYAPFNNLKMKIIRLLLKLR